MHLALLFKMSLRSFDAMRLAHGWGKNCGAAVTQREEPVGESLLTTHWRSDGY